jgi:hypothetical protein
MFGLLLTRSDLSVQRGRPSKLLQITWVKQTFMSFISAVAILVLPFGSLFRFHAHIKVNVYPNF